MEERKSMGSALVEVFDAGVVLVKSEINAIVKKVSEIAKAKGIGVVLLLAAIGPLILGLIFLILFVFYALMRLGLGAWAAALVIALVSLAMAGGMVMMGIQKLGAEVDTDMPRRPVSPDELGQTAVPVPAGPLSPAGTPRPGTVAVSDLHYPVAGTASQPGVAGVAQPSGYAQVQVEGGTTTVPVYESAPHGEAQMYGSSLNEKLAGHHDHHDDPNLQNPVVLHHAPGIRVSTDPTYREDMKKEGQNV